MVSNVAIISDIRGLVTQGEDGEEILKNKDPISENGGLLTITEFAKIIFDDGREIEIDGPTQIRLDSTFFENAAFIPQETIVNIETVPFLRTIAPMTTEEEAPQGSLDAQNDARGGVITEQLDTARTQEEPEVRELEAGREDETVAQVAQTEEPEGPPAQEPTPDVPEEDEGADQQNVTISLAGSATVIEGESATYTISTSMPTYTDLTLTVSYQTLDASTGDFITHIQSVLIKAGETSATFVVDAVDDFYSDNGEKYQVTISNPVGGFRAYDIVNISNASVTTEILDDTVTDPYANSGATESDSTDTISIKLFAIDGAGNRVAANEIAEGSTPQYVAVAFDKNGVELNIGGTVNVTFTTGSAGSSDFTTTSQTVTLGTPFSTATRDDFIADNNETFTVAIVDRTFSDAATYESIDIDTTAVTTTIKDDTDTTPNTLGTVETTHESVIIRLVACDASGAPILDTDGKTYVLANAVTEGFSGNYMAVAFDPSATTFTIDTKIATQGGTVKIGYGTDNDNMTANATGGSSASTDGSKDYNNSTKTVTVGRSFSVQTFDDFAVDNNEVFTVKINANSYTHPSTGAVYENVILNSAVVKTTITTDLNPDTVYAIIDTDKTLAEGDTITHTVSLVNSSGQSVTVPAGSNITIKFITANITTENGDFSVLPNDGVLTISGGANSATITITAPNDSIAEAAEKLSITLTEVVNNNVFEDFKLGSIVGKNIDVEDTITDTSTYSLAPLTGYEDGRIEDETQVSSPTPIVLTLPNPNDYETDDSASHSEITAISNIPDGAKLYVNNIEVSLVGGSYTITNLNASYSILPPPHNDTDFTISYNFTVTDDTNTKPFTVTQAVNITGVADNVSVATLGAIEMAEQSGTTAQWNDVKSIVAASELSFGDDDGSEMHVVKIEGLPGSAIFDRTENTAFGGSYFKVITETDGSKTIIVGDAVIDSLKIRFEDLSGTFDIKVTGCAVESDWVGSNATWYNSVAWDKNDVVGDLSGFEVSAQQSVTLTIGAEGGDFKVETQTINVVEDNANTQEAGDFTINIFGGQGININATDTGEVLKAVKITGISNDAILKDANGNTIPVTGGEVTINSAPSGTLESYVEGFTITPARGSSTDISLKISMQSIDETDTSWSSEYTQNIKITADADQPITQGDQYYTGKEDTWVEIGTTLSVQTGENYDGTSVAHNNETLENIIFTGAPQGSTISFGSTTVLVTSLTQEISVPSGDVSSLKLLPPKDFSGTITLTMKTTGVDVDENGVSQGIDKAVELDTLTIAVSGVADIPMLAVKSVSGLEDAGRDGTTGAVNINGAGGLPLSIIAYSTDTTETVSVTISDIPTGAKLYNHSGEVTIVGNATTLSVADLVGLKIVPPFNSNVDFTLKVVATSTDASGVGADQTHIGTPLDLRVELKGVADAPNASASANGNEDNWIDLNLTSSLRDADTSESLYGVVENIPSNAKIQIVNSAGVVQDFTASGLVLAEVNGNGSTDWRIDKTLLDDIANGSLKLQILPTANFSGEIALTFKAISSENDGDKVTTTVNFNVNVNPVMDTANSSKTVSGDEDTWINLNLPLGSSEDSEAIDWAQSVTIKIPTGISYSFDGGLTSVLSDGNAKTITQTQAQTIAIKAPLHSNVDFGGIEFKRTIVDDSTKDSNLDGTAEKVSQEITTTINVNLKGDADWYSAFDVETSLGSESVVVPDGSYTASTTATILTNTNIDATLNGTDASEEITIMNINASGKVYAGGGDDVVNMSGYHNAGVLDTGSGNDKINMSNNKTGASISTGDGDDVVMMGYNDGSINLGIGNDYVSTTYVNSSGTINGGDGYDVVRINDQNAYNNRATVLSTLSDVEKVELKHTDGSYKTLYKQTDGTWSESDNIGNYSTGNSVDSSNPTVSLASVITAATMIDTDNSETGYVIIENKSGITDNTTWIVENGFSIGNGAWLVKDIASSNIVIKSFSGDGTLNLQARAATVENDGDYTFNDVIKPFTINYTDTGDDTPVSGGGGGSGYGGLPDGADVVITVNPTDISNSLTQEDKLGFGLSASGLQSNHTYAFIFDATSVTHGTIVAPGAFRLPDGSYVTTDISSIKIIPSEDYSGNMNVTIKVVDTDNATGTSLDVSPQSFNVNITAIIDDPTINDINAGFETNGEWITFSPNIHSSDTDGSETLVSGSKVVFEIPSGWEMQKTSGVGIALVAGKYEVDADQINNLQIKPTAYTHGDFTCKASYAWQDTYTDLVGVSHTTAQTVTDEAFVISLSSQVDVISVALSPTVTNEGAVSIPLGLSFTQADSDGSEIASVVITGLPEDVKLSQGTLKDDGSWVLKGTEISTVYAIADEHYSGSFTLSAKAYSYDLKSGGISESTTVTTSMTINAVASGVNVTAYGSIGDEGNAGMAVNLDIVMEDTDGSETLNLTFTNVPSGGTFAIGATVYTADASGIVHINGVTLTDATSNLQFIPSVFDSGLKSMGVTVQTVDGLSVLSTGDTATVNLYIDPIATRASLSATDVRGDALSPIALNIASSLVDTDGSESLKIVVDTHGNGTLNVGTLNADGTYTLTSGQLVGLMITPSTATNFTVDVQAISTESANGEQVTQSVAFVVSAGDETLNGTTSDDTLRGYSGNDIIDGGDRTDTAIFSGNFADYSFLYDEREHAIKVTGIDGQDTVLNVEKFQFADGTKNVIVGTTGNDTITGTDGDDLIFGRGGVDTVSGGNGNDTLMLSETMTLDFDKIDTIETISLQDGKTTTLTLELNDLVSDPQATISIIGDASDTVIIKDDSTTHTVTKTAATTGQTSDTYAVLDGSNSAVIDTILIETSMNDQIQNS